MGEKLRLEIHMRISEFALDIERNKSEYYWPLRAGLAGRRAVVTADRTEYNGNFSATDG
jgi:hypothetical protein